MSRPGVLSVKGLSGSILQEQKNVDGVMLSKSTTSVPVADQISPLEELELLELPQNLAVLFLRRG
jgi:hypothetical protein